MWFSALKRDIWRRTEVIKTIPRKETAVAETSTLKQQGCNLMKFYSSLLCFNLWIYLKVKTAYISETVSDTEKVTIGH